MSETFIEPWLPTGVCSERPGHKPYQVIEVGIPGIIGPIGPAGEGLQILDNYETYEDFIAAHPSGKPGEAYYVGPFLYIWSKNDGHWVNKGTFAGGIAGLMEPDPREYFLYVLYNGEVPDLPDIPDTPDIPVEPDEPDEPVDTSTQPLLNTGKLNFLVLA